VGRRPSLGARPRRTRAARSRRPTLTLGYRRKTASERVSFRARAHFLTRNRTLHKAEAGVNEDDLLRWLGEAVERLRPRYSPPELQVSRSGGERLDRDA